MRRSPQYAVAITAVHKWEERFMREWLEYHLLVGVGHFFLFPNDCNADSATRKLLVPYERAGVVTVDGEFDCAKGAQTRAYRRSIERYGTRAAWMAFIDLDEFIAFSLRDALARSSARVIDLFREWDDDESVTVPRPRTSDV